MTNRSSNHDNKEDRMDFLPPWYECTQYEQEISRPIFLNTQQRRRRAIKNLIRYFGITFVAALGVVAAIFFSLGYLISH